MSSRTASPAPTSSTAPRSRQALKSPHVRARLEALVDGLEIGEPIPSERRLALELGVSRPTLRAVVDDFVREGRLVRRQGSGTYVGEGKVQLALSASSFTEDMRGRGMVPSSRVLSFEVRAAGARFGAKLRLSPIDEIVVVQRLRLADAVPMALETLYLPRAIAPGLKAADLDGSLYDLLARRHGVVVAHASQTIEATVAMDDEAALLGVPAHSPAFLFERLSHAASGEAIELVRSVYRGDRYQLRTELGSPRPLGARTTANPALTPLTHHHAVPRRRT